MKVKILDPGLKIQFYGDKKILEKGVWEVDDLCGRQLIEMHYAVEAEPDEKETVINENQNA